MRAKKLPAKSDLSPDEWDWYVEGAAKEIAKVMLGTDAFTTATLIMMLNAALPLAKGHIRNGRIL